MQFTHIMYTQPTPLFKIPMQSKNGIINFWSGSSTIGIKIAITIKIGIQKAARMRPCNYSGVGSSNFCVTMKKILSLVP